MPPHILICNMCTLVNCKNFPIFVSLFVDYSAERVLTYYF